MFNTQILAGSSGQGGGIAQQSLKFNDDESQYLSWTPAAAGNRKTWTWSAWVKRGNIGTSQIFFNAGADVGQNYSRIYFENDYLNVRHEDSNVANIMLTTTRIFRDVSAWYHIVFVADTTQSTAANRIKLYVNGLQISDFSTATYPSQNFDTDINSTDSHSIGARTDGSVPFDGYLSDVYFIDGQALDPTSFGQFTNGYWEKKDYAGTYGTNGFHLTFQDDVVSEGFNTVTYRGTGADQSISGLGFEPDFVWLKGRNYAEHHHLYDTIRGATEVLYSNRTVAESSDTLGLTSFNPDGFSIGSRHEINNSGYTFVGWAWDAGENNAPTGHSSVTYTGNGGTQSIKGFGFSPDLVWVKNRSNVESHNLFDSVRGSSGNYKTLQTNTTGAEITPGVTMLSTLDSDGFTLGTNGGVNQSGDSFVAWGWDAGNGSPVSNTDGSITSTVKANPATGFSVVSYTGTGANATVGHGLSSAPSIVILKNRSIVSSFLVRSSDLAANQTLLLENTTTPIGTDYWQNTQPTSSVFSVSSNSEANGSGNNLVAYCFSEVAGYSSFGSYTGTGSSVTVNCGFRPGFIMIKATNLVEGWAIIDGSRDTLNPRNKVLKPNSTNAEASGSQFNTDFTDTGFVMNGTDGVVNVSGGTYIYMAFKGSYADYVSDYNTDGTIDSRVKANPDYGFSIVSYTGTFAAATVGHGLSSAPELIIVKNRSTATNWWVGSDALGGWNKYLGLNLTSAVGTVTSIWNGTAPTSTVFSVANDGGSNGSGNSIVAYCFNSVAGYSSFGSYSGTGAAGNAVTTGFKPAFVMIRRTDLADSWALFDSTRDSVNPIDKLLYAERSDAEGVNTFAAIDFTDTGFTVNGTGSTVNNSGGTYIYMAFADTREAAFWKDVSGQGNHWTPNNLDYRDSLPDSPANNFAVMNPVIGSHGCTVKEGNLYTVVPDNKSIGSTFAVDSGKWYVEFYSNSSSFVSAGIVGDSQAFGANLNSSSVAYMYSYAGAVYKEGTGDFTPTTYTSGDVIGFYIDLDNNKLYIYKNGAGITTSEGTHVVGSLGISITNRNYYFGTTSNGNNAEVIFNFGQDSTFAGAKPMGAFTDDNSIGNFQYAPPAGYLALCTANLTTPTIIDGSEHFNTVLYAGNSTTGHAITGVGFQPDWVWLKGRNYSGASHSLTDSVRGATKRLSSDSTSAEITNAEYLQSFDADGFTVGTHAAHNASGYNYVAWNWKAGGTAVSNTDGSITSQVSANTAAGFSIVSWTGAGGTSTVGHGLGGQPSMIIAKNRDDGTRSWIVYHKDVSSAPETDFLRLESTNAVADYPVWGDTAPTSSVFTVGDASTNGSGDAMIAYCFADVEGFSKAGSYTGNGSSDGPFVYTGFRPAWVMFKSATSAESWNIVDSERNVYNVIDNRLYADSSAAESAGVALLDFTSNGFKLRATWGSINASGQTFIYLAFAEHPFKYANAR
jgi:hypothetical protein